MTTIHCPSRALVALALLATSGLSEANGINPPRPAELALVQATCYEDPEAETPSMFRSHLVGGRVDDVVEFRSGRQGLEESPIANVRRIAFDSQPVVDGFVKAKIALRNRLRAVEGSVKVRNGDKPILLTGFLESGERVEIPMTKCVQIEFFVVSDGTDAPKGPPAKKF